LFRAWKLLVNTFVVTLRFDDGADGLPCVDLAGLPMPHDWIFDVLSDLKLYAERNGLSDTAAKAAEALMVARAEIRRSDPEPLPKTATGHRGRRMN
jgi:hypothetical protein